MLSPLYIIGPTASQKNDFALSLSSVFGAIELMNLDSAQVYKELTIGANIPTEKEQALCPHHLFAHKSVLEPYNVSCYLQDLQESLKHAQSQPLVVGGTMMYLHQHLVGLVEVPELSQEKKDQWRQHYQGYSQEQLFERLTRVDLSIAQKISSADRQRTERALMVYDLTQTTLSEFQSKQRQGEDVARTPLKIVKLNYASKEKHWALIKKRIEKMCRQGLIEEASELYKKYPESHWPFWKYVGYRQIREYLEGYITLEEALEKVFFATCQLAKRQKTWMKKFTGPEIYVDEQGAKDRFLVICQSMQKAP